MKKSQKRQILYLFLLCLLCTTLYLVLEYLVLTGKTIGFDNLIILKLYLSRSSTLNIIMIVISLFGKEIPIILGVFFSLFLFVKKHKKGALFFSLVLFTGVLSNIILKNISQRPRPEIIYQYNILQDYSFPSGHAMWAFICYTSLTYLVSIISKNNAFKIILFFLSTIIIFLVGASRIYLGVHYPTDVLGGFIAGMACFCFAVLLEKIVLSYKM